MAIGIYPLLSGPPLAGGFPMHLFEHMARAGTLSLLLVDAARDIGIPVLVAVPCALLFLFALVARRLKQRASSSRPFEPDPIHTAAGVGRPGLGGDVPARVASTLNDERVP
jgi:hypothetical protein